MKIEFDRRTVSKPACFEGKGIHTGLKSQVIVSPGRHGIVFSRDGVRLSATPGNVARTPRSTWLGEVRTVEHLMSAMAAIGLTDAEVVVSGAELPILDGAAAMYYDGLLAAGLTTMGARSCKLFGRVNLTNGSEAISISAGNGRWRYVFESDTWLGSQSFDLKFSPDAYRKEIAPARTFVFESEMDEILSLGLGKGGDEHNTLVIGRDGYVTRSRFEDEVPRHKMLDCIGDIWLAGVPPQFLNVVAERTGHEMNVKAAARLADLIEWEELSSWT